MTKFKPYSQSPKLLYILIWPLSPILIKSNFANVSQQEYWAVLPQYFYDNEFRLSYYFYFLEPWNIFQIENLEVFTPYYLFLTGIVPILSETLIIGPNKFNLLPEYLLSDLSIHV